MTVKFANHLQGERPISTHDLVYAGAAANHANERCCRLALLLQPETDGLNWVWNINRKMLPLECLHERGKHFQPVPLGRSFWSAPQPLDFYERHRVLFFISNRLDFHTEPSLRRSCRKLHACLPI